MPLFFVHGVNVRYENPGADPYINARNALFRKFALESLAKDPAKSIILNPYWGHLAAKFPWNHGGLPTGSYEIFGDDTIAGELMTVSPDAAEKPDAILLTMARESMELAVDTMWKLAARDLDEAAATDLALEASVIAKYVEEMTKPPWLDSVSDDNEWLTKLVEEAHTFALKTSPNELSPNPREKRILEVFGNDSLSNRLFQAAASIRDTAVRFSDEVRRLGTRARKPADELFMKMRAPMHRTLITFLGDVFVYFRQREKGNGLIENAITADLRVAIENRKQTQEPLIIIAHSMGGIIIYDLLTSTMSDVEVDILVTVGSQVAAMEELKLFVSSDPAVPDQSRKKVPKPRNVKRWINVFDTTDILGFAASGVFEDVQDYSFATGHAWAHGAYFVEPMFHRRLGMRLR